MRHARTIAGAAMIIALVPTLAACGGKDSSSNASAAGGGDGLPDTITIGVTSEKTGPVPTLGLESTGIQKAAAYINANGGIAGKKVKVVVHDNAGMPATAVNDLRTFAQQGIKIVLGGAFGPDCAAEAPIAAQSDMVVFCGSTDNLPEPDDHMFGIGLGYTPTIKLTTAMIDRYSKRAAVFADKNKSGDDTAKQGPADLKALGNKAMLIRTDTTASSFKASIQKAIAGGADALWFSQCTPAAISAVGEAISLGFKGKIALENCLASIGVAQALKGLAGTNKQIIINAPAMLLPGSKVTPAQQQAIDAFRKGVPGEPDVVKGAGWDSLMLVKKLLEQTKTLDVKTNIAALEDNFQFTGVWHGGTMTAQDHRGATGDGYATPAYFTNKGTLAPLD